MVILRQQDVFAIQHLILICLRAMRLKLDLLICRNAVAKFHNKGCAITNFTGAVNRATKQLHQVLADVKSKSRTIMVFTVRTVLFKWQEHPCLETLGNSDTIILYNIGMECLAIVIIHVNNQRNPAIFRREFQAVGQKIHEDPFHMLLIHQNIPVLTALHIQIKDLMIVSCLLTDDRCNRIKDGLLLHRSADGYNLTSIDLAGFQDFLHKANQILTGCLNLFQIILHLCRKIFLPEAKLCQTEDRRHRCPHVMRHMGEEGLLLLTGLYRLPECLGHLVNLLLIIHLLCCIYKGNNQTLQLLFTRFLYCIRIILGNGFPGQVWRNTDQIGLTGNRRAMLLDCIHRL